MCFGDILTELRQDKQLTQRQLADILHVSVGTISNYENGVHLPDVDKLTELADVFDTTTDYLLGRTQHNLSPTVFSEKLECKRTVAQFVEELRRLPPERQTALMLVIDDMAYRRDIEEKLRNRN